MALSTAVSSVLQFLHAGYPEGVPRQDYVPLLALLRRRLTEDEVDDVANGLIAERRYRLGRSDARGDLGHHPRAAAPGRYRAGRAHLASGGWPLTGLDDMDDAPAG